MTSFFGSLLRVAIQQSTLTSALTSLGAVAFAAAYFAGQLVAAGLVVVALAALGAVLDAFGRRELPRKPVRGLRAMEAALITPISLAVVGGGAIVILGASLDPPKDAPAETKALLTALSGAISALITLSLVKGFEDSDGGWVADRVQREFEATFKGRFPEGSDGAQAVFSEPFGTVTGWGWEARKARASAVATALETSGGA